MATKIDLTNAELRGHLRYAEQSYKRAIGAEFNPLIKEIKQKELDKLTHAIATMTEIK